MLGAIKNFFENNININAGISEDDTDHRLHVATAALLIEVMRADHRYHDDERAAIVDSLAHHFGLTEQEVQELVALAEEEVENSVDHYEFTSLIKNNFEMPQKIKVIELMWQVAYADQHLEKYEEALIRKISELIYVPHSDFIAAKHRVIERNAIK